MDVSGLNTLPHLESPGPSGCNDPMPLSVTHPTDNPEADDMTDTTPQPEPSRAERLARIQAEIAAGTYDTHEKLEAAIDKMIAGRVFSNDVPD